MWRVGGERGRSCGEWWARRFVHFSGMPPGVLWRRERMEARDSGWHENIMPLTNLVSDSSESTGRMDRLPSDSTWTN